jgi:hypothetical protein
MSSEANAKSGILSSASKLNSSNGESDTSNLQKYESDYDIYNETFSERGDDLMEMDDPTDKSPAPSLKSNGTVNSQHSADQSLNSNLAQNSIADASFGVNISKSL